MKKVFAFSDGYKDFLSACKTERECTEFVAEEIEKQGYKNIDELIAKNGKLKAGDKVYANNMGKGIAMFQIGSEPFESGMSILGAHIDSPRLDLKQNPLYEDTDLAMFETHYYGGIKKYQWTARPMAIHGVICKADGTKVKISIGEDPEDPVLGVSDLLIHLAGKQMDKKGSVVVEGEDLNVLLGSIPVKEKKNAKDEDKEKEPVKAMILKILKDKYGVEDADFESSEIGRAHV